MFGLWKEKSDGRNFEKKIKKEEWGCLYFARGSIATPGPEGSEIVLQVAYTPKWSRQDQIKSDERDIWMGIFTEYLMYFSDTCRLRLNRLICKRVT